MSPSDYSGIEENLGFSRIREILQENCLFLPGKEQVRQMKWSSHPDKLKALLNQTAEFKKILEGPDPFPSSNYIDVRTFIEKLKPENAFLEEEEIWDLCQVLNTVKQAYQFFKGKEEEFPFLRKTFSNNLPDWKWVKSTHSKLETRNKLKDKASSELATIRRKMSEIERNQQKVIQKSFNEALRAGMVPEGASVSVRSGRTVIPILSEYKRKIRGIIHDISSTGSTVFLEPDEAIEIANQHQELVFREKREVEKILREISATIRENAEPIMGSMEFLGEIDFIRSKAKLGMKLNACLPKFLSESEIHIKDGFHPLFILQSEKEIVPLNIALDLKRRIVLISGPNAGGKSVALKTVGLLQYMYQCGLLVPVDESSRLGIFEDIFLDIGDQQSIENDLSTYSSHLKNMMQILENGGERSLILIDEMGSGTEPKLGAAIAEAILEGILAKKCMGVITTHYSNLKQFAETHSNIENAAMLFDKENLRPFYILEQGRQGGSFALEVAQRIGLPGSIIERSKELAGKEIVSLEEVLAKLDREKNELARKTENLAKAEKDAITTKARYDDLKKELDRKREMLLSDAARKAEVLIKETNKEIEKTIRHIKENKAEKKETKKIRNRLKQFGDKIRPPEEQIISSGTREDFKKGDHVYIIGKEVVGEIIELKKKEAVVLMGNIKTKVPFSQLEHSGNKQYNKGGKTGYQILRQASEIRDKIDIRGKRADEAIQLVDKFLDDALIAGFSSVSILHGKGDGILRKIVRDNLKRLPYVDKFEDEHIERGGDGVTLVYLK